MVFRDCRKTQRPFTHELEINGHWSCTATAFYSQNIIEASKSIRNGYFIRGIQYFFAVHYEFVGIFARRKH